jgi:hypothetical protein
MIQDIGSEIARELSTDTVHVEYMGDVDLPTYGGTFIIWSRAMIHYDYFYSVEVIDLDSACGFDGASMIEVRSCYIPPERSRRKSAYESCGEDTDVFSALYALQSYGYYDQHNPEMVYQLDENGKLSFDGWHAEYSTKEDFIASVREAVESCIWKDGNA